MAEEPVKSCCTVLKERYSKLEEKRNALRQAVKLLEHQIDKLQTENLSISKALEEERARVEAENEAKVKESTIRVGLENEILNLKSEISSLRESSSSRGQDEDLLQIRVSEGEAEITRLKELLEKERKRGDSERKKAEAEKKKAAEAWKLLKSEKSKADEGKKLVDIERKCTEEFKRSLEALKTEANEVRAELVSERSRNEEAQRRLEAEKKKANREKKRADSEMAKAEQQKKCMEEERKKAMKEKNHSDQLSKRLEEERQRNVELQKEVQGIMSAKKLQKVHLGYSEEAHRRLETEQQKAMKEKCHSDHLSEQLEKERRRNKQLEKEMQEIMSARKTEKVLPVHSDSSIQSASADMMFLEKQLKLEKMHVKHAKRVAKLERTRNNLLQQEVCRLKQDLFQYSHRLNVLDGCFSHGIEGIGASAKIRNSSWLQDTHLQGKLSGKEPCELYCQSENEVLKDGRDRFCSTLAFTAPLSGGSCAKPISGISSELESVMGGSVRNKLQNSAIYSTTTSFSDRTLVGSQGRGAFSVTTSAKFTEENSKNGPAIPRLSDKITKLRYDENLGVVAENNVTSPAQREIQSACLNSNGGDSIKVVGRSPGHTRKKKRSRDAVESTEYLYEDKKLLRQIDGKLSALHDMIILKSNLPAAMKSIASEDGKCQVSTLLDEVCDKNYRFRKKEMVLQKQELILEPHGKADGQQQIENVGIEVHEYAQHCNKAVSTANHVSENVQACRDETVDAATSNQEANLCFENMDEGDFMRFLDLDNPADEERYRMAMEMPLSPTLPEINFPNLEASELDESKYFLEGHLYSGLEIDNNNMVLSCSLNISNVEIDSNNFLSSNSGTSDLPLLHLDVSSRNSIEELNNNDGLHIATDAGKTCADQVMESTTDITVAKQMPMPVIDETEVICASDGGSTYKRISKYSVVFSNVDDKSSISRIICASKSCISKISMVSQTDLVVHKILLALAMEQDLLPEERASVFFSLLLYNFSVVTSMKFKNFLTGDSSVCSDSFAAHIKTVMFDAETKRMLLELCHMDTLLRLIQDFLIDRRVLFYNELSQEPFVSGDSESIILLGDGVTIGLSSKTATIDQLVIGSITMASICAAIGYTGFICEASYDIIQKHKSDSYFILTVLHVFASICGEKYSSPDNNSLIMTAIKSIVVHLERGHKMVGTLCVSNLPSISENHPQFPQCAQCIFSEGAIPVDKVILLLLEKLHSYTLPWINHQHMMESVALSNCNAPPDMVRDEQSPEHEVCPIDRVMDSDASCFRYENGRLATLESDSVVNGTAYNFSDILSLVELVSRCMSWNCTCSKTIPQLLHMLESCVSEKFSAAIIVLLGQLGRLGIDNSGDEQMGVEELRCSLSSFLDQNSTGKWGLPTQFATVHALIGLLSIEFEEVIQSEKELPVCKNGSGHYANLLRKWFSQLSEEKKSLIISLFKSAGGVHAI
ncbi:hypothetical protein BVC80_8501g9 [Macleaya cordata]|uniref:Maternal effect embryo arrest 22 n=1 Tax=Macleaya cordata TaxID=56857 RepID=A0A200Q9X5_MACCD|nr:hypothetical protein BVC80_8501g9 [Macleaya cordata]